ncbi:MAG: enoyl-CoA hydratase/isomerase family protein, partial [Tetrasphaera sp.]|nr:enoyl-CoA hydratase/isomerase family protein [Tetrasphaera sp.]
MPILTTTTDRIVVLSIDRPERRNALNLDALEDLDAAVRSAVAEGARVIVLTGTDGHFCAGADLKELEDVSFTERLAE